jgi:hypothetical protein
MKGTSVNNNKFLPVIEMLAAVKNVFFIIFGLRE